MIFFAFDSYSRRLKSLFLLFLSLLLAFAVHSQNSININGQTQGTTYSVVYYDDQNRDFTDSIDSVLVRFSKIFSSYDSTSLVSKINNNQSVSLLPEFVSCFQLAQEISVQTEGAFDITVSPLVEVWGFGVTQKKNVSKQLIDSLKQFVGYEKVSLANGQISKKDVRVKLVFNAIAQGYSVDLISKFLLSKQIHNFFVEIGGEVRVNGTKPQGTPWVVGVERPDDNQTANMNDVMQLMRMQDLSISTSGYYRNYYLENGVKYAHTIHPKTGYPVQSNLLSATIIAKECAVADAYATACMVMGLKAAKRFLQKHPEIDAVLVYSDKKGVFKIFATKGAKLLYLK